MSQTTGWTPRRVNIAIWIAAFPAWGALIQVIVFSPKFTSQSDRFFLGLFILGGTAGAIHRLLRGRRHAWALSALFAGVLPLGVLFVAAALARFD